MGDASRRHDETLRAVARAKGAPGPAWPVDSVLVSLTESLGQFDQALGQGAEGRRIHIAAGVELRVVSDEAVQIVRVMDGLNRVRFAGDPDLLAAWKSASNVVGPSRSAKPETEAPPSEGAVKPAA